MVASAVLVFGFAGVSAFRAFGVFGLLLFFFMTLLLFLAIYASYRSQRELIDEMEVAVVFNRFNNSFCRFVPSPEPEPGHNHRRYKISRWIPLGFLWLRAKDPYFIQLKWYEKLEGKISKKSQSAKGRLDNLRTVEGIPVSISWKVSYTVDVTLIKDAPYEHKMARALPENSDKVVSGKTEQTIRHLVETRTIRSLYEEGAMQALEQLIAVGSSEKLGSLGIKEIAAKDVALGPLEIPAEVEKAIKAACQRKIQTEMTAETLERLKLAIGSFSQQDMHHLAELERLRILDEKDTKPLFIYHA